jgi:hypothetical protein
MKKIALIMLAVLLVLLFFGCTTVERPEPEGTECTDETCFAKGFLFCDKSFGEIAPDLDNLIYGQVIGKEDGKCKIYIEVVEAKASPVPIDGLNAICKVTPEELMAIKDISEVNGLDCYGPLFDAAKTYIALQ